MNDALGEREGLPSLLLLPDCFVSKGKKMTGIFINGNRTGV